MSNRVPERERRSGSSSDDSDFDYIAEDDDDWLPPSVSAYLSRSKAICDEAAETEQQVTESGHFYEIAMRENYYMPIAGAINRLDILLEIFAYIPAGRQIVRCAAVCASWRHVIRAVPQWKDTGTLLLYKGRPGLDDRCDSVDAFRECGRDLLRQTAKYQRRQQNEGLRTVIHAVLLRVFVLLHWSWYVFLLLLGYYAAMMLGWSSQAYNSNLINDLRLAAAAFFEENTLCVVGFLIHRWLFGCKLFGWCRWPARVRLAKGRVAMSSMAILMAALLTLGTATSIGAARIWSIVLIGATPVWFADCPLRNTTQRAVDSSNYAAPTSFPVAWDSIIKYGYGLGLQDYVEGYSTAPTSTASNWFPGAPPGVGPSRVYIRDLTAGWSVVNDKVAIMEPPEGWFDFVNPRLWGNSDFISVPIIALVPPPWQRISCGAQTVLVMTENAAADVDYFQALIDGKGPKGKKDILLLSGSPARYTAPESNFVSMPHPTPHMSMDLLLRASNDYYAGRFSLLVRADERSRIVMDWPSYLQSYTNLSSESVMRAPVASVVQRLTLWNSSTSKTSGQNAAAPSSNMMRLPLVAGRDSPVYDFAGLRDILSNRLFIWVVASLVTMCLSLMLSCTPPNPRNVHSCFCESLDEYTFCFCCNRGKCFCPTASVKWIWVMLAGLILSPLTMSIAGGACYFNDSTWCFMTKDSALALFIAGLLLLIVLIGILLCAVCR